MQTPRRVTERDFRMPEFRDADPEDYEFRGDGKVVRKDRWERAVSTIRHMVGVTGRDFDIPKVIEAVQRLAEAERGWEAPEDELPDNGQLTAIRVADGSCLVGAEYNEAVHNWTWQGRVVPLAEVCAWRKMPHNTD